MPLEEILCFLFAPPTVPLTLLGTWVPVDRAWAVCGGNACFFFGSCISPWEVTRGILV